MNKIKRIFTLIILFCGIITYAQKPFVTTWKVTGGDTKIKIPTYDASYRYSIRWVNTKTPSQKGSFNNVTGDKLINFKKPGIYRVEIKGRFPGIYFGKETETAKNRSKILSIEKWGDNNWINFTSAFRGCINLDVKATDAPNLSEATNMQSMFEGCKKLKGNNSFRNWKTSTITDMSYMFKNCIIFNNQYISNWDTKNVETMFSMFDGAAKFNQLLNWNTSDVNNMRNMFRNASQFNQDISNWDTSKVNDMSYMFNNASQFNQDISNWNTSNVTTMQSMFNGASNFNNGGNPLTTNGNKWNTSKVTNMSYMFRKASSFNQPIGNWNTENVVRMSSMFDRARKFNQPLNWSTRNVTKMDNMFNACVVFNQPLNWNTSKVTNMSSMFRNCVVFNQPIGNWNVSKVKAMNNTFKAAKNFNQDISEWIPESLKEASEMFKDTNLSSYHFSKIMKNWAKISFSLTSKTDWGDNGLRYANTAIENNTITNLKNKNIIISAQPQNKEGAGIIYKEKNNNNEGYTLVGNKENGAFEWLTDYTPYDNIDGAPNKSLIFKRSGSNLDGDIVVKANSHLDNREHIYKLLNEVTAQQETLSTSKSVNNVAHKPGIIAYDAANGHFYEATNSGWERIDN